MATSGLSFYQQAEQIYYKKLPVFLRYSFSPDCDTLGPWRATECDEEGNGSALETGRRRASFVITLATKVNAQVSVGVMGLNVLRIWRTKANEFTTCVPLSMRGLAD